MPISINGGGLTLGGGQLVVGPGLAYGEQGFSSSAFYAAQESLTVDAVEGFQANVNHLTRAIGFAGSSTTAISMLIHIIGPLPTDDGGGDRYLLDSFSSNEGFVLYVTGSSNQLRFHIRSATTTTSAGGPVIEVGKTYAVTGVIDGDSAWIYWGGEVSGPATLGSGSYVPNTTGAGFGTNDTGSTAACNFAQILGMTYTQSRRPSAAEILRHHANILSTGVMSAFPGGSENLYQAPALQTDLIGGLHWTETGSLTRTTMDLPILGGLEAPFMRGAMVRVDAIVGNRFIWGDDYDDGTPRQEGNALYVSSIGEIVWRVGQGAAYVYRVSPVTVGKTYAVACAFDGAFTRLVVNDAVIAEAPVASYVPDTQDATAFGARTTAGGSAAGDLTIASGVASEIVAPTLDELVAYTSKCMAAGDMVDFDGCMHRYSARKGLGNDIRGGAPLDKLGASGLSTVTFTPDWG